MLTSGHSANVPTSHFPGEACPCSATKEALPRLRRDSTGLYDRIHVSHGSGDASIDLLEDLDALCTRIHERSDDAVPFEFMGAHGLMARRVENSQGVDEDANIVYDPERIA